MYIFWGIIKLFIILLEVNEFIGEWLFESVFFKCFLKSWLVFMFGWLEVNKCIVFFIVLVLRVFVVVLLFEFNLNDFIFCLVFFECLW